MKPFTTTMSGTTIALAAALVLFAVWGLALWLYNALFYTFSQFFVLDSTQSAWTLSLLNIVYLALAIPAALFNHQFGYKLGLLFGLSVFALGAFLLYLAIIQHSAFFFLCAVVMVGSCGAWLDTALNPLAAEAGNPATAVRRLNLAQAVNGIGLLAACIFARWLVESHYQLSWGVTAEMSARPYVLVGLGAILLAFFFEQVKLPDFATNRAAKDSKPLSEIRPLLQGRDFVFACATLAAYSVVITVAWSAHYRYNVQEQPGHIVALIERGFLWFVVGRWIGTILMRWIEPLRLLQWCAGLSAVAVVVSSASGGILGWLNLVAVSLFISIVYPTIFATALHGQGIRTKIAAGLLAASAGAGNALAPLLVIPAMNMLNIRVEILVALPFLAVIFAYASSMLSRRRQSVAGQVAATA